MPRATPQDVQTIAGRTVTVEEITRAEMHLELFHGVIVDRPDISDRDREWLKRAVAYQAAWMQGHPDLYEREDVTSVSQDGESAAFRNVDAHLLAPLARKALRRLSWKGRAVLLPGSPSRVRPNVLSESFDDSLPWKPLG